MDQIQEVANIDRNKFSSEHYNLILEALDSRDKKVRVVSYNMLHDMDQEKLPSHYHWKQRVQRLADYIKYIRPDIICTQELQSHQLEELKYAIGNELDLVADLSLEGEINGIFFRSDRFLLKNEKYINIPGSAENRMSHILLKVTLEDKKTGKEIIVLNTHFPYESAEQRLASTKFILEEISGESNPVILAGDFNTIAALRDYQTMPFFDGEYICSLFSKGGMEDAQNISLLGHLGPIATFTNDPKREDGKPFQGYGVPGIILDHIFVSSNVQVLAHGIDPLQVGGYFPSDHFPVIVDAIIDD